MNKMVASKLKEMYENYREKKHERGCAKLEKKAEQLRAYHTSNMLIPGQEEQWYYSALDRAKTMKDKSVTEILRVLRADVQCHDEIQKRLNKQLKKSQKKTFDRTIEQCFDKMMKEYISQREIPARNRDPEILEKPITTISDSRTMGQLGYYKKIAETNDQELLLASDNTAIAPETRSPSSSEQVEEKNKTHDYDLLLTSSNVATASKIELPESITKIKKPIRKRCRFCGKRGHSKKDCVKKLLFFKMN